ncbi:MAG: 30S ribosomal protein S7 [Gammaproteobacteria bacterium]|nr:30S ribosomal protein S7 [Gammaproteobacteria bacterium]
MSRRKAAPKRKILPDPLFKSELLAKFVNVVMLDGKKAIAEKIVYHALDKVVQQKRDKDATDIKADDNIFTSEGLRKLALELFDKVLDELRPAVEVRSRRVGGATYQVPVEVPMARGIALAMRWLVEAASKRNEKTMSLRLANEMLDVLVGRGGAMKKRETVHSMAKANQAFAHFRW